MKKFWKKHLILLSVLIAAAAGVIYAFASSWFWSGSFGLSNIIGEVVYGVLVGMFFVYPVVLTLIQIAYLLIRIKDPGVALTGKVIDGITIFLGITYSILYTGVISVFFGSDWTETLSNSQVHTPIFTESYPTVIVIAVVAILGYLLLNVMPLAKMPPLVIVCGMAALYLGIAECILYIIQISVDYKYLPLALFPLNWIFMSVRTVRNKILEWNEMPHPEEKTYRFRWLSWCNRVLSKSGRWPLAALLLTLPLLGILIALLALFGQHPDAAIKAWTETSDWNLSKRVAPQNVYFDEHYLCTVAAGGHEHVVKPLRLGMRHGHEVIVNRQLCVANAFEQILEERTPSLHRHIRRFYDTYGFPVAKLIRSPFAADVVYLLMKPLEWFFLAVLYFCDVNPENRIAVQYMGQK